MKVSGIILAGGKSSRMGRDKSLLEVNHKTLIEQTIEKIAGVADEIIIASNNTAKYHIDGCVEVPDRYPGMGPLAGMQAGLSKAQYEYSFIISCDMPLFSKELAAYLLTFKEGYDVVVPVVRGRWEPLCAVYSKNCLKPIEDCLAAGISQVFQFYQKVKVCKVEESKLRRVGDVNELFYNMNTPADLNYLKYGRLQANS